MDVVKAPDQRLRIKTKPVKKITPLLIELCKAMIKKTKDFKDPEGVGLAATQIGKDEQFFVALIGTAQDKNRTEDFKIFINPKILSYGKKTKIFFEGCLSVPDYYGEVERPTTIKVSYLNDRGAKITEDLEGSDAWFFQHEFDHLQGKLFIDYVLAQKSRLFKTVGKDRAGADIFEEVGL